MASSEFELLLSYLDGSLPADEAVRTEHLLKAEPALAELFVKICRDETIMKEWSATVSESSQTLAMPVKPASRLRRPLRIATIAIAASLFLAVGLVAYLEMRKSATQPVENFAQVQPDNNPSNPLELPVVGRLEDVQGEAFLVIGNNASPIRAGQEIRAGQQLKTGDGGVAVVQLPDSSRFELGNDTQMTFSHPREAIIDSGVHLFLWSGTVRAEVPNQASGKRLVLTTPHATIKAENTRFSSVAAVETTSVETQSGQIEMTMSNGEQVNVPEGRLVVTGNPKVRASDRPLPPRISTPRRTLAAGPGPVVSVVGNPVANTVAINTWDSTVLLYDLTADKWLPAICDHSRRINGLAFSRDGKLLATGGEDRFVRVTNLTDRSSQGPIRKQRTNIHALAFSNDNKVLVTTTGPYKGFAEVLVWDRKTGDEIGALPGHPDFVDAIAFHPKEQVAVTACRDGMLRVWDVSTWKLLSAYPTGHRELKAIVFAPDGKRLASAGREGLIRLWNTNTWTVEATLEGHLSEVCSLAFSPDGTRLASSGMLTTIWLWDVESAMPIRNYVGHKFKITAVAFSADGKTLISSGWDRMVKLWDIEP